jgi:hypothetical protein
MIGKSKVVITYNHKYYLIRPKVPQQQIISNEPTKQASNQHFLIMWIEYYR